MLLETHSAKPGSAEFYLHKAEDAEERARIAGPLGFKIAYIELAAQWRALAKHRAIHDARGAPDDSPLPTALRHAEEGGQPAEPN